MIHRCLLAVVLCVLPVVPVRGQETAEVPKTTPVDAKVRTVNEVTVEAGKEISVPEEEKLHVFAGVRPSTCYIAVEVRREIPANAVQKVPDLKIHLQFGITRPVTPYAVAVAKKYLEEDGLTYQTNDKRRGVGETYYFPVVRGQRDWTIMINDKAQGKVLDHFATVVIHDVDQLNSRLKLPDDTFEVMGPYRQTKLQFPAGSYELVMEVRGRGKVKLPWPKYDKGGLYYLAVVGDLRNAPTIPGDKLRKALPLIERGYRMYSDKRGFVGGGSYNIGTADDPVHVRIDFGRGGTPGPLYKIEADRIVVEFADPEAVPKRGRRKSSGPNIIGYSEMDTRQWLIRLWEKAEFVEVDKDAKEVVGEVVSGSFTVRSVERNPSVWTTDGLLSKGIIYDKDLGYIRVQARKEGDLAVIWGEGTKEP